MPRDMGPLPPGSVLVTHLQPEHQEGLGCPRVLPTKGTDCHSGPEDEGAVALGQLRVRPSVAPTEESPVALWGLPPPPQGFRAPWGPVETGGPDSRLCGHLT